MRLVDRVDGQGAGVQPDGDGGDDGLRPDRRGAAGQQRQRQQQQQAAPRHTDLLPCSASPAAPAALFVRAPHRGMRRARDEGAPSPRNAEYFRRGAVARPHGAARRWCPARPDTSGAAPLFEVRRGRASGPPHPRPLRAGNRLPLARVDSISSNGAGTRKTYRSSPPGHRFPSAPRGDDIGETPTPSWACRAPCRYGPPRPLRLQALYAHSACGPPISDFQSA